MSEYTLTSQEQAYLRRAIELAREARADGRHPFGSLVVDAEGVVVVESRNNVPPPAGDPTQHAELLACAAAAKLRTRAQLASSTLFTSTEPCAMCAGAIYWTGIGRVIYALAEKELLRFTGNDDANPTLDLPCRVVFAGGQRRTEVAGPYLEDEAGTVHAGFWRR